MAAVALARRPPRRPHPIDPMALQASAGACGALDPLLLPLENKLAAKPATKVCCCCEDLRMGLMIITGVFGLSFLADGVAGLIGSSLWPVSVIELVFSAVSAYGFYGLYSRRPEAARLLARMNLLLGFCTLLLLVTMPLWVRVLCSDLESIELSSAQHRCAGATASIACADHNACLWNATTSACEHSPTHRVWGEDGACLIDFEVAELVTCVALIAFLIYLAWAFIGYALQFERGEGASIVYAPTPPPPPPPSALHTHRPGMPLCLPLCHLPLASKLCSALCYAGPHACRAGDPEK